MSSSAVRPCFLCLHAPASSSGLLPTSRRHRSSALPPAHGRNNRKPVGHAIVCSQAGAGDGHAMTIKINPRGRAEKDYEFREEGDRIEEYFRKFSNAGTLHMGLATIFRGYICRIAKNSVRLASIVMGKPGIISEDARLTTLMTPRKGEKMALGVYVRNFVSTAEDAYNDKVTEETIVTFLGALQGVAAMSYFMAQDTLANIGDDEASSLDCGPDSVFNRPWLEYMRKTDNLRREFKTAPPQDPDGIVMNTVTEAMKLTESFVRLMTVRRRTALLGLIPTVTTGSAAAV
ncbi:uncharacterized protein [Aegilops tauschii subsp. strangulata]|nr:uncharacterized protein LOC109755684 [Aegilops tauschii subsp. strangulata]XP_044438096.1 uncharacterized protein LOC123164619 [Triticum aestivum]